MATNGKNHLIKISGVLNAYTIKSIETELQSHLEKAKDILNIDIIIFHTISKYKHKNFIFYNKLF